MTDADLAALTVGSAWTAGFLFLTVRTLAIAVRSRGVVLDG